MVHYPKGQIIFANGDTADRIYLIEEGIVKIFALPIVFWQGVGYMSIFGLKKGNMIKPMNQILTLVSPIVGTPLYLREKRIVVPTTVDLGLGGILVR